MAAQDTVMRDQDAHLDSISRSLGLINNMGLQIRDELDMQNNLLDDIEGGVNRTHGEMMSAQGRMKRLLQRTNDCKWMIAIVVLVGVVLILLSWVFRPQ
ncbi:hypothetical protein T492DRAFT_951090 [Pavlovales sp. CCMP2436]|nr:hypothetical protein T492DRAFT_951090 [Pavlovales sp. CCMP2436]